jgi:hypothetical protein
MELGARRRVGVQRIRYAAFPRGGVRAGAAKRATSTKIRARPARRRAQSWHRTPRPRSPAPAVHVRQKGSRERGNFASKNATWRRRSHQSRLQLASTSNHPLDRRPLARSCKHGVRFHDSASRVRAPADARRELRRYVLNWRRWACAPSDTFRRRRRPAGPSETRGRLWHLRSEALDVWHGAPISWRLAAA